jgi:hypothetical protein
MKKAVCVGVNNYPGFGNDLQGCVNDAQDWSMLLNEYGFETSLLLDSQATRQNIKAALDDLVNSAADGDVIVFSYSGHGTQYLDTDQDEGDVYDEALFVYDGKILDDEMRVIIEKINPRATLLVISDSCFSGSVTRIIPENTKPRFMPVDGISNFRMVRQRLLLPESGMPELLITGCSDSEYSYDAKIEGRYNGAMSAMAIRLIRENPGLTYNQFFTRLRQLLPSSDYPQSPQLEGSQSHKDTLLFEPFEPVSEPGPTPTPEPTPTPQPQPSPGCIPGLMRQVSQLFKSG